MDLLEYVKICNSIVPQDNYLMTHEDELTAHDKGKKNAADETAGVTHIDSSKMKGGESDIDLYASIQNEGKRIEKFF